MILLTVEEVISLHEKLIDRTGGIGEKNRKRSSYGRIKETATGGPLY